MSLESQHSANPDTPPPEYSVHVPNQQSPPSSQHSLANTIPGHYPYREQPLFSSSTGPQFAPPSPFGPTPLMQSRPTLGLLPYYDPHSPYSIETATSRARWRFIGAAFWTIALIVCLLLLVGIGYRQYEQFRTRPWNFGTCIGYLTRTYFLRLRPVLYVL